MSSAGARVLNRLSVCCAEGEQLYLRVYCSADRILWNVVPTNASRASKKHLRNLVGAVCMYARIYCIAIKFTIDLLTRYLPES